MSQAPTDQNVIGLVLAASPSGIGVLHVYGAGGTVLETLTGSIDEMRDYAATRYPSHSIQELTS